MSQINKKQGFIFVGACQGTTELKCSFVRITEW